MAADDLVMGAGAYIVDAIAARRMPPTAPGEMVARDGGAVSDGDGRPDGAARMALTVPARPEHVRILRTAARDFAQRQGVEAPDDVALAITEAATNAVVHAYPAHGAGSIELTARRARTTVTFVVEDRGLGLRAQPVNFGLRLGLALMARLTERFTISPRPGGGVRVQLTFPAAGLVRRPGPAAARPEPSTDGGSADGGGGRSGRRRPAG
jgi:serine/threonine-protein kinase RsbW/stage II sporulation protein AB (anti-sigma F factor)